MKSAAPQLFSWRQRGGFTLIEIIMALAACAVLLAAIYGVFSRAIHLRDDATRRTQSVRAANRVSAILANDLRNALVSGGTIANQLEGSREGRSSSLPGYLKFTATTGRDGTDELGSDVQQIEYYLATDAAAAAGLKSGILVRAVDRNLLAPTRAAAPEIELLAGVESMEVTFYDGSAWKENWKVTDDEKTLPQGVRVIIRQAATEKLGARPPIEILVPWTTQPAIEAAAATDAAAASPTPP